MLNPLIDEIFERLLTKQAWKVHTLALELSKNGIITVLDNNPYRDLFKRNFLIMNALFQLQQQLAPAQTLSIASLHIKLEDTLIDNTVTPIDPLRDYYLDWQNYDASTAEVDALLNQFWQNFAATRSVKSHISISQRNAILTQWQLDEQASLKMIQKRWRQLAFQYHPDKPTGSESTFKKVRQEYEQLKLSCPVVE